MPMRHNIVAIVLFWLAASGWLFYREFWPYLRSEVPPPFTIDLLDQTWTRGKDVEWHITRNEIGLYRLKTDIKYRKEDDDFEISNDLTTQFQDRLERKQDDLNVKAKYRVARDGTLRGVSIDASIHVLEKRIAGAQSEKGPKLFASFTLDGVVREGLLYSTWKGSVGPEIGSTVSVLKMEREGQPIAVEGRNTLLNPLVPLNRMADLRPSQHWRVVPFDPIADVLSFAGAGGRDNSGTPIDAVVRPEPAVCKWMDKDVSCFVVDYDGPDFLASTWVRERDGLVIKQEATLRGEKWVMTRLKE